jgi:hypothetical protein
MEKTMMDSHFWARISVIILLATICYAACTFPACVQIRADPHTDNPETYCLIISCKNEDTVVEIYAPEQICHKGDDAFFKGLQSGQRGFYALDLNNFNKGKPLEPINLRAAKENSGIVVDQFTRRLPPTTVPREGGEVSFDTRFASNMRCSPLFETGSMLK